MASKDNVQRGINHYLGLVDVILETSPSSIFGSMVVIKATRKLVQVTHL